MTQTRQQSFADRQWDQMMQVELEATEYSAELERQTLSQMITTLSEDDEDRRPIVYPLYPLHPYDADQR